MNNCGKIVNFSFSNIYSLNDACLYIFWLDEGASTDPCDNSYCGPKEFSEREVRDVAKFLTDSSNIISYISMHSYSQMW